MPSLVRGATLLGVVAARFDLRLVVDRVVLRFGVRVGAISVARDWCSATLEGLEAADSTERNKEDHAMGNRKFTAHSVSPAPSLGSPIRPGGSIILACDSNMNNLPDRPGETRAWTTYTQYDGSLSRVVQHLEVRL